MRLQALLRTKSIEQLQSEIGRAGQFRRVLGLWQLTAIGLGGLIGVGIFVLTGVVAATQAGPAVSLSFVIAGIASAAAALWHILSPPLMVWTGAPGDRQEVRGESPQR
jgi:APA family basic amino acid/polyamine antiporter